LKSLAVLHADAERDDDVRAEWFCVGTESEIS